MEEGYGEQGRKHAEPWMDGRKQQREDTRGIQGRTVKMKTLWHFPESKKHNVYHDVHANPNG